MAIFNESSIGAGLIGKVGEGYIRNQNGKKVFCQNPTKTTKEPNNETKTRRNTMRRIMNISKVVTKDPVFHTLWKNCGLKGPAGYHKFNGFNFLRARGFNLEKITLSPEAPQFFVSVKEVSFSNQKFFITLHAPGNECGINFSREKYLSAGGVVIVSDGTAEKSAEFIPVILNRTAASLGPDTELKFELGTPTESLTEFREHTDRTVLVVFSTLNSEEQPVKHSKTFIFRF